MRLLLLY